MFSSSGVPTRVAPEGIALHLNGAYSVRQFRAEHDHARFLQHGLPSFILRAWGDRYPFSISSTSPPRMVGIGADELARAQQKVATVPAQRRMNPQVLRQVGRDLDILGQQAEQKFRAEPAADDLPDA